MFGGAAQERSSTQSAHGHQHVIQAPYNFLSFFLAILCDMCFKRNPMTDNEAKNSFRMP
jgi:lipase chaperone LimK